MRQRMTLIHPSDSEVKATFCGYFNLLATLTQPASFHNHALLDQENWGIPVKYTISEPGAFL